MVEDGQVVVKPALSEPVLMDFPQVGTLEAFNTDGLRSLLKTINARNMKEKTLRYPGHRDLILALRETGFFGKEGIEVKGIRVAPADVTARLLFPLWALEPGEQEFTLMRVVVEGSVQGRCRRYTYDLYDEYEPTTGMTSMARTTGFPCVIVARMLAEGSLNMPGVHPPEVLGMQQGMLSKIIAEMAARGVFLHHHEEEIQTLG
jgi:saccharopine dehydrogenase-like NADP-dependent oxidoreductase